MEKNKIIFEDLHRTGEVREIEMPNQSKYDFLLERNKNYMNFNALSFEGMKDKVTYEELHDKIWKYARALYKKGIRKGDLIGFCAVNTPESIYVMYALDIIGAITIGLSPLNNEYQMRRDIEMIKPQRVITVDMFYGNMKGSLNDFNVSPILYSPVESMQSPIIKAIYKMKQIKEGNFKFGKDFDLKSIVKDGSDSEIERWAYSPDYVSDIMFTGGSTGRHKGVELYGNGFNCLIKALDRVFFLEPGQIHLGNVPVNHMVFGKALTHYVLCNNMEYALTLKMGPNDFTDEIIRTGANGIMGGPIHFENMINNSKITPGSLASVEQAVSGGEAFKLRKKQEVEETLRKGGSNAVIANAIGATETESVTHVDIIDTRNLPFPYYVDYNKEPVTCGYPIPGVEYRIVDKTTLTERGEIIDVAPGESGLFLVSGPTIMKGYYQNPEENAKVFVTDSDGKVWFNQGDLMRATGKDFKKTEFTGRVKRNFVSGVSNIYPEEIEELLLKFDEIREAVIVSVPDEKYQYLPVYHISLNYECDTEALKGKIDELIYRTVGEDALPGFIEYTLSPLPRTDNGKLNAPILEQADREKYIGKNKANSLVRMKY